MKRFFLNTIFVFKVGSHVFAKWSDDDVWYRVVISQLGPESCIVTFSDYGNEDTVVLNNVVTEKADIPKDAEIDEHVFEDASKIKFRNSDLVIAKWPEDNVWYRAEILAYDTERTAVTFVDYGNVDVVNTAEMVCNLSEIPADDDVDENVVREEPKSPSTVVPAGDKEQDSTELKSIFKIGDIVLAKWAEDNIWYRASITEIGTASFIVTFIDYGNSASVQLCDVVSQTSDIPKTDEVDEHVIIEDIAAVSVQKGEVSEAKPSSPKKKYSIGDSVYAKWDEDQVWYRADVTGLDTDSYAVIFTDYGNSAQVKLEEVVKKRKHIPKDAMVDEFVKQQTNDSDTKEKSVEPLQMKEGPKFSKGDTVIAKWSEDDTWYRAEITDIEAESCVVTFIDYGNSDAVMKTKIVTKKSDIPQDDLIDENVTEEQANPECVGLPTRENQAVNVGDSGNSASCKIENKKKKQIPEGDQHVLVRKTPEIAASPEAVHSTQPSPAEQSQNMNVSEPSEGSLEDIEIASYVQAVSAARGEVDTAMVVDRVDAANYTLLFLSTNVHEIVHRTNIFVQVGCV